MSKIKVLAIQVDVTNLSEQEIEDLQVSMEAQCEAVHMNDEDELEDAVVINSGVRLVEVDDDGDEDESH